MNLNHFQKRLEKIASEVEGRHKLAALVFDQRGNPISFGANSYKKTNPAQASAARDLFPDKIFLHAEIHALTKASNKKYGILVIRLMKDGTLGLARPCQVCFKAIRDENIKKIFYSDEFGDITNEYVSAYENV